MCGAAARNSASSFGVDSRNCHHPGANVHNWRLVDGKAPHVHSNRKGVSSTPAKQTQHRYHFSPPKQLVPARDCLPVCREPFPTLPNSLQCAQLSIYRSTSWVISSHSTVLSGAKWMSTGNYSAGSLRLTQQQRRTGLPMHLFGCERKKERFFH